VNPGYMINCARDPGVNAWANGKLTAMSFRAPGEPASLGL